MGDRLKRFGAAFGETLSAMDAANKRHSERERERNLSAEELIQRAIATIESFDKLDSFDKLKATSDLTRAQRTIREATPITVRTDRPWPTPVNNPPECDMYAALSDCLDRNCFYHRNDKRNWERKQGIR